MVNRKVQVWTLVCVVAVLAVASSGKADVPIPAGPPWIAAPGADYGIVQLNATYESPTLINYASRVYDKDTNVVLPEGPNQEEVDRAWSAPEPGPQENPPHYAGQRNVVAESTSHNNQPGHLLWRVTGGTYPMMNVADVNLTDKWRQVQTRQATDPANDVPGGHIGFGASFVVKAQAGQIKFIVLTPTGQPAVGAACYVDTVGAGFTSEQGIFVTGPLPPQGYACVASLGMMNTFPPVTTTVTKGNTSTVTLTLHF